MAEDTFTKIDQAFEGDGSGGISEELRIAAFAELESWTDKVIIGKCRSMEAYADAVGYLRGLNFFLTYAERKAEKNKAALADTEEAE